MCERIGRVRASGGGERDASISVFRVYEDPCACCAREADSRLSEGDRKWAGCGTGVEIEGEGRKGTAITSGQN